MSAFLSKSVNSTDTEIYPVSNLARLGLLSIGLLFCSVPSMAATMGFYTQVYERGADFADVRGFYYNQGEGATWWEQGVVTRTAQGQIDAASLTATITSPLQVSATALAQANVNAGTVGVLASSNWAGVPNSTTESRAGASMTENLTFVVHGATASTVTPISMIVKLHGNFSDEIQGMESLQAEFGLGEARINAAYSGRNRFHSNVDSLNYFMSSSVVTEEDTATFSLVYNLIGATTQIPYLMYLEAFTSGPALVDFSHTGSVQFALPSNVTFTSASGVFLTAAAVPEPATWAVMIIGFGLAGGTARRLQAVRAPAA